MAMEKTVLVLGGGGVKGLAHIGAWQAAEEAGERISGIVGTSIGALVGACLAGGMGWRDLAPLAIALRKRDIVSMNNRSLLLNGIRQPSLFHGGRFIEYIRGILPVDHFEELSKPLAINAVDLETGEMAWFGTGGRTDLTLAEAVYASCALPLFYPPAKIGGRHYVDGGVLDALPIEYATTLGADRVIAVDVTASEVGDSTETISQGMIAIHQRVFGIMSQVERQARLARWDGVPLIYVRPRLEGISTFDFSRNQFFLEEGYRATRQALMEWREVGSSVS
jgi:NTE family protein